MGTIATKRAGMLLVTLGFLAAAWVGVQDDTTIAWGPFAIASFVGVLGVVLARRGVRAEAEHAETVATNIETIRQSLENLAEKVARLNREQETTWVYDVHGRIDELLLDDIRAFVDARETIAVRWGLQAYADVMSHFAAGERYINRVWSASADGYVDEVAEYLQRAEEQFAATLAEYRRVAGEG